MSWFKRITWALAVLLVLAAGAIATVLGTSAGTRWLFALVEPHLPAALGIEDLDGSVLAGLRAGRVRWEGESFAVGATGVEVTIELLPLTNREVRLPRLRVGALDVALDERESPSDPAGPPAVRLPVGLTLQDAVVNAFDVRVGQTTRSVDRLAVSASLNGTALALASLAVDSEWLSIQAYGDGRLEPPYTATLETSWRWRSSDDRTLSGSLSLDGNWTAYSVQHALNTPFSIQTDGEIFLENFDWSVDLVNEWERIETVIAGRQVHSSDARFAVAGNLEGYDFRLDSQVEVDGVPAATVAVVASGDLVHLDVSEAKVDTEPMAFSVQGRVGWDPRPDWALDVDVRRIDPNVLSDALNGELSASGRVVGRLRDDRSVDAEVVIGSFGGKLNDFPIEGNGEADVRGNRVANLLAEANVGENRALIEGALVPALDLSLTLDAQALDELLPRLGGGLTLNAEVSGSPENPSVIAELRSPGIRWDEMAAEDVAIDVEGRPGSHRLSLSGTGSGVTLSAVTEGGLADGRWDAELESMVFAGDRLGRWSLDGPARLSASPESISANDYCVSRSDVDGNLCLDLDYSMADKSVSATFDSRGVPLDALVSGVSDEVQARGTLAASGEAHVGQDRLDGRLEISIEQGGLSAQYEGDLVTTDLEQARLEAIVEDGRLSSEILLVLGGGLGQLNARVNAADLRDAATGIEAELAMAIDDLTLFALFAPEVSRPAGRLDGKLSVTGTATEPEFQGSLAVRDGRFDVPAAGIAVEDVNVDLSQSRLDQVDIRGSARSGDGLLSISGRTSFRTPTGVRTVLDVTGENVELLRVPDREIIASPDLRLEFDDRQVALTGAVRVPSASFVINEVPRTAESPSPDAIVYREEEPVAELRRYSIDVRAELGESVRIEGFGLSTNVEGSLQVQSSTGSVVRGNGRLALVGGRYEAYGQDLTIERGELVFNGPLDRPDLNIRATRSVDNVVAGIQLTGTPDQLSSTVFSEPAMSDAEALSYLLTGRPLSSASAGEGTSLNEAAFALGLSQAGAVTSQIQNTLGLDSLTLEGGADSGRIVAGRRVGGRLFVEYGYGLVDQLGTLLLRFQLTDRIVVESSSGSTHTLNIFYRVTRE